MKHGLLFLVLLLAPGGLPAQAQFTVKAGVDLLGTYTSSGTVPEGFARVPGQGTFLTTRKLRSSTATSPGVLVGGEFADGGRLQVGLGVEHLFPRALESHDGTFSFTSVYALVRGKLDRRVSPVGGARFGWTRFHGDDRFTDPDYTGVYYHGLNEEVSVHLRSGFHYGLSGGIAVGKVRAETILAVYTGRRIVREVADNVNQVNQDTSIKARYSKFGFVVSYSF